MNSDYLNDRWMINRIGLINFWYYDEEEFSFCDGRLLLRGSNGSGKSVTMQSFIPLLLDGNKSPERLDPFGSRARKLENYLLGEDEDGREESTGYLYMEFQKQKAGNYLTIGMGLKARKGKNLDFWGFAITDGRRIGRDFFLYKDMGDKVPLSKIELRNRLDGGGELYDSQGDYMAMVNRLLFGFENLEDYDELIKLLVQLRTPKLSKDFKPTVIYEIMNNSLQPLSDEDLRPMSEAIENMDNIKSQLEVLKESKKAVDRIKNEYGKYNRYVLFEKSRDFVNSQERLDKAVKEAAGLENERDEYHKQYILSEEEHESLKSRQESLEHKKRQLEQHDSFKAKQEIDRIEGLLKELSANKALKDGNLDAKKNREIQLHYEIKSAKDKQEEQEEAINRLLEEMSSIALGLHFYEHDFAEKELKENLSKEYNFRLLRSEVDRYREKITRAKKALELEKAYSAAYDRTLSELEAARREREESRRELEKAENVFAETKEEFIEKVYNWEKQNVHLKLDAAAMTGVVRAINGYGQTGGYDDIAGEVRAQFNQVESGLNRSIAEIEAVKAGLKEQLQQKQRELNDWKNQKDPELQREGKAAANRRRLKAEGVPFVPFYMAVDFRDDVPADIRGRLEEALIDMGLLDALIVPQKFEDRLMGMGDDMGDRYIFPKPQFFRQELSLLLKPVVPEGSGITYEDIDNALKSIMLDSDKECAYINEKGEYSVGLIKGKTSREYIPKFLGAEARKRYRQENISRLEAEVAEIDSLIRQEQEKIKGIGIKINELKLELGAFPGKEDLETAFNMVGAARIGLEARIKDAAKKEELADKTYKELKDIREKVRELITGLEIAANLEAYEEAESDIGMYRDLLGNLETMHVKLMQLFHRLANLEEQREEVLSDIDGIMADLRRINRDIQDSSEKKRNYEELLKELNYDEIRIEIDECIKGLREIPGKIEQAIRNAEMFRQKHGNILTKLEGIKEEIAFLEKLNECCREGFRKEYNLGYVVKFEEDRDIGWIARKVYNELKGEEKEGKLREDYASALQERYHENRQYIAEYNLIIEQIFDKFDRFEDERLNKALASQKRFELSARIQGRDVNFFTLSDFIDRSIEENEKLLRESDRQLFEDILANTVGKKIRGRIYHSEQWVKKMNGLMESMNTSSGLSFSLIWKNRVAETEEQLDTKELVDILKSDVKLLNEEQMDRLAAHFRSKIAQARKEMEDKGTTQTFHAIMRDILDYRKWFEFQLFYKKQGETRKELTNNAFDKFSGGEKAMAMYVPLFSSVFARYEGARKDCPRIISLDEAFAGVDENNIRDMFRLIEELKLNFIINSQILWGDYDTVPALSICELIRPNNADFVTVIRYRWDGKVRELLMNDFSDSSGTGTPTAADEAATAVDMQS